MLKNCVWKIAASVEGCAPTHLKWDQICQQKSFHQKNIISLLSSPMTQLLLLGKFEYGGGLIFKVVLEC